MRSLLLTRQQLIQTATLTFGAVVLYAVFRILPTGTNLHGADFGANSGTQLQLCDPANPQFVPVSAVQSPVTLTLKPQGPIASGAETQFVLHMETTTGKPIGPVDLLVAHTRKLHLMVVDPTLTDYQHIHPEPIEGQPGDWTFAVTPHLVGDYRVFADFTPVVTARSLYASADFQVPGAVGEPGRLLSWEAQLPGWRFKLTPSHDPIRAGQATDLSLSITNLEGGDVPLETVMDAYAHLVAFDEDRSGFAHLHPDPGEAATPPDPMHPVLHFKLTIPQSGLYVIWAQVKIRGEEMFAPFWFEVKP